MSEKRSLFIHETREREAWLAAATEREGTGSEGDQLLAAAALTRGVIQAIPVSEGAEERSRQRAVAYMQELHFERLAGQATPRAPWYLRLGRLMRYVFTFGRRR